MIAPHHPDACKTCGRVRTHAEWCARVKAKLRAAEWAPYRRPRGWGGRFKART